MIHRAVVLAGWTMSLALSVAAVWRFQVTQRRIAGEGAGVSIPALVQMAADIPADTIDEASAVATDNNPFRRDRTAAEGEGNVAQAGSAPLAPPSPAPMLTVRGILGGPPWTVVLQGVPGAPQPVVLRVGDTIAGFSIVRVRRDTVVVRGAGSLFTLALTAR